MSIYTRPIYIYTFTYMYIYTYVYCLLLIALAHLLVCPSVVQVIPTWWSCVVNQCQFGEKAWLSLTRPRTLESLVLVSAQNRLLSGNST